jgi:hypothetical protein
MHQRTLGLRAAALPAIWNLELSCCVHMFMRYREGASLIFTALLIFLTDRLGSAQMPKDEQAAPSLTLQVRTDNDQTVFHVGELIRLHLSYSASGAGYQASTASYDRSGRLGIEKYLVQPETGWDDPLKSYYSVGGFIGGGLFSIQPLSAKPYTVDRDLNEWVRFNQPGRYHLVVSSTRVSPTTHRLGQSSPELRSNDLWITVIPATAEWQETTLANAVAVLNREKVTNSGLPDERRERAVATIRYLGTSAAAQEMARRLDDPEQFQFMLGLIATPTREAAVAAVQRVLNDPLAPVSSALIHTLSRLTLTETGQNQTSELTEKNTRPLNSLIVALAGKRGAAQTISAFTVAQEVATGGLSLSAPQRARLSAYLVSGFDSLPARSQADLLQYRWEALDQQTMLHLLPKVAERYRDGPVLNEMNLWEANNASAAALQHWWELDPASARPAILVEISRPKPRFGANVVGMLPEKELPEVDELLANHLVIEGGHDEVVASLIARYATSAIEPRVMSFLEEHVGQWRCDTQTDLLAYLLRVDAPAAAPMIERALNAREQTGCYRTLLTEVAQIHNDLILGKLATKSLMDDNPEIVSGAASYLGTYGSAAAEPVLWTRLESWTQTHPGKPVPSSSIFLAPQPDDNATDALIMSIATGAAWLADESKLNRLLALASTDIQRNRVEEYLRVWRMSPKQILVSGGTFNIAQYSLRTVAAASEKLKQFPHGATFAFYGDLTRKADQEALAILQSAAASVGITVEVGQQREP